MVQKRERKDVDMEDMDMKKSAEEIANMTKNMGDVEKEGSADKVINMVNEIINKVDELTIYNYDELIEHEKEFKILQEQRSEQMGEEERRRNLSNRLKAYEGRTVGKCALRVLEVIAENNKEEKRKITVKFMGQETSVADEIDNMKKNVKDNLADYDITYDYDENNCINRIIIEEVK